MHNLTKKPLRAPGLCFQTGLCLHDSWRPLSFLWASPFLELWTNGFGKKECPNPLLWKQEFVWVAPPSDGQTGSSHCWQKGQKTLNKCKQPCSCTDKMLAPAIYLQGLLFISFCSQLCQYVGAASLPLVPALCSGMVVRKQQLGCHLHLVRSSHTHSAGQGCLTQS